MKWSEAKEKADNKVWADLELRPTGKVLTKEQYDYAVYYAKHTGIDCRYVRSFDEEKGKYLRLGNWFGGASYYFFLEINQRELLKQPLQTIGTLLKHSKNIMRIFLMAN